MKTQQFLEHHGIRTNPFAEEDAQTDPVFKDFCILEHAPSDLGQDFRRPGRTGHVDRLWRKRGGQDRTALADRAASGRLQP